MNAHQIDVPDGQHPMSARMKENALRAAELAVSFFESLPQAFVPTVVPRRLLREQRERTLEMLAMPTHYVLPPPPPGFVWVVDRVEERELQDEIAFKQRGAEFKEIVTFFRLIPKDPQAARSFIAQHRKEQKA